MLGHELGLVQFVKRTPPKPNTLTIGLSASIATKIAIWIYNETNYMHLGKDPVRFGSVVTKKLQFLYSMS